MAPVQEDRSQNIPGRRSGSRCSRRVGEQPRRSAGDVADERTGHPSADRRRVGTDMLENSYREGQGPISRRREQVRHLLRSVGVHLDGDVRVPFFVEVTAGKFRRNPRLKGVEVKDDQLCTLKVPADTPAKIPSSGLPQATLVYLVEVGLSGSTEL